MLRKIDQTNENLLDVIKDYGCLFLCFAYKSPLIFEGDLGVLALNKIWKEAVKKRYISKNDEILEHEKLANEFFALDVIYDGKHRTAEEEIPENVSFVFGKFVWKFGHFVVLDKNKKVVFDSLGDSFSVKNGKLESMRWYYNKQNT